jgi:hypothetical protein
MKDADGNELTLGTYITKVGICKRITESSLVDVRDITHKTHSYVYGHNGGSGYIRSDQLKQFLVDGEEDE